MVFTDWTANIGKYVRGVPPPLPAVAPRPVCSGCGGTTTSGESGATVAEAGATFPVTSTLRPTCWSRLVAFWRTNAVLLRCGAGATASLAPAVVDAHGEVSTLALFNRNFPVGSFARQPVALISSVGVAATGAGVRLAGFWASTAAARPNANPRRTAVRAAEIR